MAACHHAYSYMQITAEAEVPARSATHINVGCIAPHLSFCRSGGRAVNENTHPATAPFGGGPTSLGPSPPSMVQSFTGCLFPAKSNLKKPGLYAQHAHESAAGPAPTCKIVCAISFSSLSI